METSALKEPQTHAGNTKIDESSQPNTSQFTFLPTFDSNRW